MVPKEALVDAAVRADVAPGLKTRAVAALLARYAPDASAPDPLPPGLLDALADEADDEEEEEEAEGEAEPEPPRRRTASGVFGRLRRSTSASTPRPRPRRSSQADGGSASTRPAYTAPSEAALLAAGVVDAVALDQGAESDGELADLAAGAGAGGVRFDLLRALWASAR